jgi:uncharacterized integral membrane protein
VSGLSEDDDVKGGCGRRLVGRLLSLMLSMVLTDINKATVVLKSLHGTAFWLLWLVLLGYLWALATHFTGTSKGSVDLTYK